MSSPKRKSYELDSAEPEPSKKTKLSSDEESEASEIPISNASAAPDSRIDHKAAIAYWQGTEATVSGVLGGFPEVSRVDIQGSSNFLAKLRRSSKRHPPGKKLRRAADCGAGIGRITEGLLSQVAEVVDIVEPVESFTDAVKGKPGVGEIFNVGLEAWHPDRDGLGPYDLIWNQWCVGQLTDVQLVDYLQRMVLVLSEGGWIVVKENLSNHNLGEDVFDSEDSSVTRTDTKFRELFGKAGLKLVSTELQRGMPKGLYPVRAYALQPR
ncbi:hypothetical protein LTR56_016567 [Elasticomyces elasticus]|nr:hypothetical protein LTR56_016567 [Elasticomyces elasticus]KAK3650598.1 hypothetical protein LTR22_012456 [Elasticomyces elasticus]KAK4913931.1 hypothetical protein LTR49_017749 [Elasticomyces elasticus]KAK5753095.1 hypothetical protein LTS12_016774 [Elasticomyces elasticus]